MKQLFKAAKFLYILLNLMKQDVATEFSEKTIV